MSVIIFITAFGLRNTECLGVYKS